MDEDKIVLDRKSFEALAVDTRVKILKSLKERRKTLSEIAKEQDMSVSGVKEHLETLENVGLIVKIDDGHKWKYYELTRKGSDIVAPRELRVWILLSISMIALVASMIALYSPPTPIVGGAGGGPLDYAPMAAAPDASMKAVAFDTNETASAAPGEADSSGMNDSPLLTAGASAEAGAAPNATEPRATAAGSGAAEPPEPQTQNTKQETGSGVQESGGSKADMTLPMAVAAISGLTLLLCAGVLIRNRMKRASLG